MKGAGVTWRGKHDAEGVVEVPEGGSLFVGCGKGKGAEQRLKGQRAETEASEAW